MSDPDWWHTQPGPFDIKRMEAEIERLTRERDNGEWQRVMKEEVARVFGAEIERLRAVNKLAVEQNFKDHAEIERLRTFIQGCSTCKEEWEQLEARRALEGK